ncbi:MAG: hypothetical protein AAF703_19630 [Cyanobacteria bacterium P01_D01_bin.105]
MTNSSIHLRDLLAPTASSVFNHGSVFKDDRELSLWLCAQDIFGWRNWLQARQVPFEGNANEMLYEAGDKLLFSRTETDEVLATARVDQAIPACVYKGDEDESIDFNGDVVAWGHLFNLQPALAAYCPPEMKAKVGVGAASPKENRIDQYRDRVPKKKVAQPTQKQGWRTRETTSTADTNTWKVDKPLVDSQPQTDESDLSRVESTTQLDTDLAQLGREIVARIGEEQDGQHNVTGKVKYRISINLADNTMRIYAKDRGDEPILVDANGNIDHVHSRVVPEDVTRFQAMVDGLRIYQQPTVPKKVPQIGD